MKLRLVYIIILLYLVISCINQSREKINSTPLPNTKKNSFSGYLNGQNNPSVRPVWDTIVIPSVVKAGEPRVVTAGRPKVFKTNSNVHPAGTPKVIVAGLPDRKTPGQDSFKLPVKNTAIDNPFKAGIPDVKDAREPYLRDNNQFSFSSHGKLQGLNSDQVECMTQDTDGNLWIGSLGGISKYDGKAFTNFTEQEGLTNIKVYCLLFDTKGNLWFGTNGGGITKYDGEYFTNYMQKDGFGSRKVYSILEDRSGNLWFGTEGAGVICYDGNSFINYCEEEGFTNNYVSSIIMDRAGNIWFGTFGDGAIKFDGVSFFYYTEKQGLCNNISSILEDKDGILWFCTKGRGVSSFDGKVFKIFTKTEGLSNNNVKSCLQDKRGNLWFGTDGGGASKFDGKNFYNFEEKEGFSKYRVNHILQDRSGNMWFSTDGAGFWEYEGELFAHFTMNDGLTDNKVNCIIKDKDGNFWFGTERGGLSKFDGKSFSNYTEAEGLFQNSIYFSAIDSLGNLWFATDDAGVIMFDGKHFVNFTKKEGLISDAVKSILIEKSGRICFTAVDGISFYDGKTFTNYNLTKVLTYARIYISLKDKEGNFWFGTEGDGLLKFRDNKFTRYSKNSGLGSNTVYSILEDNRGKLWFGTSGGGVAEYDGESFINFTDKEGLSSNYITSALQDKEGNLWFGSRFGLNVLSKEKIPGDFSETVRHSLEISENQSYPSSVIFNSFTFEDGYHGIGSNRGSIYQEENGNIWIGANEKLTVYHPNAFQRDTLAPHLQITEVGLFNENINWVNFESGKKSKLVLGNGVEVKGFEFSSTTRWYGLPIDLKLRHKSNFLTFKCIGITQRQNRKEKYQYKLEGLEENWTSLTFRNEASYGNLAPGVYVLKVKAVTSEGFWSNEFSYKFTILPPWWKTVLFKIFAAFFIVMSLYLIYVWRVKLLLRQKKELEILVREKTMKVTEQKEELQSANQELMENVKELSNQREEMEATLHSLKDTQEKLFQAEKMASIGILASGVAHEINNPLNFINGGIQGIETYIKDNMGEHVENVSPLIEAVNTGLTRATEIVKSLNSFSRQTESNTERCDIHTIINNCLVILNNQTKNWIEIKKEFTADLFKLTGNEGKLHQAILNILTNAIQAVAKKGTITITTRIQDSLLLILVHDTGNGISTKIINKIFDPFFTTREQGDGKGLGLSFSYQIIQELKGTIEIQSEIGEWTTVTISLPIDKMD